MYNQSDELYFWLKVDLLIRYPIENMVSYITLLGMVCTYSNFICFYLFTFRKGDLLYFCFVCKKSVQMSSLWHSLLITCKKPVEHLFSRYGTVLTLFWSCVYWRLCWTVATLVRTGSPRTETVSSWPAVLGDIHRSGSVIFWRICASCAVNVGLYKMINYPLV